MVSEMQPGQAFSTAHPPTHPDTMGENNTLKALNGCKNQGHTMVLHTYNHQPTKYQLLTPYGF